MLPSPLYPTRVEETPLPLYPGRVEDAPPLACIPGKDEWFKGVLCLAPSIMKPCLDIAEKFANCKPRCRSAIFTAFISYSEMRGQVLNQITPSHPLPFIYSYIQPLPYISEYSFLTIYLFIYASFPYHASCTVDLFIHTFIPYHSSFTIHLFIHSFISHH